jgi:hypothetical protein
MRYTAIAITGAIVIGSTGGFLIGQQRPDWASAQPTPPRHLPYTSQPVTPGQPSTYTNTVGQCPFYEVTNAKGCIVPPNLTCNADWSVCTPKQATDAPSTIQGSNIDIQPAVSPQPSASSACGVK